MISWFDYKKKKEWISKTFNPHPLAATKICQTRHASKKVGKCASVAAVKHSWVVNENNSMKIVSCLLEMVMKKFEHKSTVE